MNKLQTIFKIDERQTRNKTKEVCVLLIYCLLVNIRQAKYLWQWQKSLRKGRSPLSDSMPWFTYPAISYLSSILHKDMLAFEYGSGGSTLYLASHIKEVTAVEHDEAWGKVTSSFIKKLKLHNASVSIQTPSSVLVDKKHEYFRSVKERGKSFKSYVTAIDDYPDDHFDIVVVDGRARVACVREAYSKIKNGGYLILDNSERKDYYEAFLFMKKRSYFRKDFFGIIGYQTGLMQTTVWKVKKSNPAQDLY